MTAETVRKIALDRIEDALNIFGRHDEHLKNIEEALGIKIVARGSDIAISGSSAQVAKAENVLKELNRISASGNPVTLQEVTYAIALVEKGSPESISELVNNVMFTTFRGKPIKPRTHGQKLYLEALHKNDIVIAIGPAGTGKTYLAVAAAVEALRTRKVSRLILTRPAVEAGEKLGFLPGDLQEKVNPYLRPLYDALYDILGLEKTQKYLERNVIEIAPLAYMRGRTLEDSFIILDEAQNTTPEQMKMFLTRLGLGSKAVITGDITQIDLPRGQVSGLVEARQVLQDVEGIAFQYLTGEDVMRHPLIQRIINAYAEAPSKAGC